MDTNEIVRQFVITLVRAGLLWFLGAMATKNPTISKFIGDWITSQGGVAVVSISIGATLFIMLQAFYTRMRSRLFAKVALQAPPATTLQQVDQAVKEAPITAVITANPDKV